MGFGSLVFRGKKRGGGGRKSEGDVFEKTYKVRDTKTLISHPFLFFFFQGFQRARNTALNSLNTYLTAFTL